MSNSNLIIKDSIFSSLSTFAYGEYLIKAPIANKITIEGLLIFNCSAPLLKVSSSSISLKNLKYEKS